LPPNPVSLLSFNRICFREIAMGIIRLEANLM